MMKMKKAAAALLAVIMVLSLLACIAPAASADTALGGPVTIDTNISASGGGISVGGKDLPNDVFVVCSSWSGSGIVSIKLGGTVYRARMGVNAFKTLAAAAAAAQANYTIYVAAGTYTGNFTMQVAGLKFYGPYGGISPNKEGDLSQPNAARPAAESASATTKAEAVLSSMAITRNTLSANFVFDGFYWSNSRIANSSAVYQTGTTVRNSIYTSSGVLFDYDRGMNFDFLFENNRVFSCARITYMGGTSNVTVRNNYIKSTDYAVRPTSFYAGGSGAAVRIEGNYFAGANGIFAFDRGANGYQTAYYSVQILNNTVNGRGTNSLVQNRFYDLNTIAGTNIHITGNDFINVEGTTPIFNFPRQDGGSTVLNRYIININRNRFYVSATAQLLSCAANAVLDCSYNYYSAGTVSRTQAEIRDYDELILYPYYLDEAMTVTAGDAKITAVNLANYTLDEENKTVTLDARGLGLDSLDLSAAITVSSGCTWKLFEDATLSNELTDKRLYFDGMTTYRYAAIYTPDGKLNNVYTIVAINDYGTEARLLKVEFDTTLVPEPVIESNTIYHYALPENAAFVNYSLRLSSGATYELYADSLLSEPLEDLGGYIPYGGYHVYIKITSEDRQTVSKYELDFQRDRSESYDPSVIAGVQPESGSFVVRQARKTITYFCPDLLAEATFDFKVTPGAAYTFYKDSACTEALSSSAEKKAIALAEGSNTFYVKVSDSINEVVMTFNVMNGTRSSDTEIQGVSGSAASVSGNEIVLAGSSDNTSVSFLTRDPYTVCRVFADPGYEVEVRYTSNKEPVEGTAHVIENRFFQLQTALPTNRYYVISIAEDGTEAKYTFIVTRNISAITFVDVPATAWYAEYVNAVGASGMMSGEAVGTAEDGSETYKFRPNSNITRQEVAVVIARLLGLNGEAYSSVKLPYADTAKIADWALNSAKVCYINGAMQGSGEGGKVYFYPTRNITRQEIMVILARTLSLNGSTDLSFYKDGDKVASWAKSGVEAAIAAGLVKGDDKGNINPTANITRAEMAAVISRI